MLHVHVYYAKVSMVSGFDMLTAGGVDLSAKTADTDRILLA